jgi:tetratricopeptide (TPR) repeat protein
MKITKTLTIVLVLMSAVVWGQDIYDFKHSLRYADYLFDSGDYELATKEYERALFQQDTLWVRQRLTVAYRRAGQYTKGLQKIEKMYAARPLSVFFIEEKIKLLLLSRQFTTVDSLIQNSDSLNLHQQANWRLKSQLLAKNFTAAQQTLTQSDSTQLPQYRSLRSLLEQQQVRPQKSPLLAATMSAIIPGAGKFYTRDWKDGLIGFVFIGSMMFQSYRGFAKKGVESVPGWLYGTVGLGFHLGNIYGSVKSAKQFNNKANEKIYSKIKAACYSDF